jgi:L-seryl-tRNA(Ser) seleniumtransferase
MAGPMREIPPVHRFTTDKFIAAYDPLLGHATVRGVVQHVLEEARKLLATSPGALPSFETMREAVIEQLAQRRRSDLVDVINGTGVLLHTNFGRAPLAPEALQHASRLGGGYTNLEYDLTEGMRGSRYDRVSMQLCELSGAQAALVVNNCAAAVLLVLDTFARDRDVVVSRGQLIEIGGGFRLPDVLRKSGARLVEVGTTNKTYVNDFRNAWSERTAMFMRSHPSNYRVCGFTAEVDSKMLAALAKELQVISFEDLGSGAFVGLEEFGLPHEPTVREEIEAGLDLVAVSGDKLLGGPQCGIICGKTDLVAAMKRNPLLRALRVDKLTLSALSATLRFYLEPGRLRDLPLFGMIATPVDRLRERATAMCTTVANRLDSESTDSLQLKVVDTEATTGGGTLPLTVIPSAGISLSSRSMSAAQIAEFLRKQSPPIVGRVEAHRVVIDLRTVLSREDEAVTDALCLLRNSAVETTGRELR